MVQQVPGGLVKGQAVKSIEEIQIVVARAFNISVEDLKGTGNKRAVAIPRQVAMYIAKQLTDLSLPEIGRHFDGKHHTTVMHSITKISILRRTEQTMETLLQRLLAGLESPE